jgi:ketosteroid isomerase-like protein
MIDRTKAALLALAVCSLAGCRHHHRHADAAAVTVEVRKDAQGVVAAYNAQDAHKAASFDAPDYVGVYHGTANTDGPAADEAGMRAQMAAAKVDWQLGADKVTVARAGDLAVFEAPYTFTINVPNAPTTTERGTWIAIFKRQDDGSMKLWRSIASDGPPAKPAQAG